MPSATPISPAAHLFDPSSPEFKKAKRQYQKATKNRNPEIDLDWSPFRAAEKRYKARFPPPNLSNVLDLATLDTSRQPELSRGIWVGNANAIVSQKLACPAGRMVDAYILPRIPGLVILPSFIPPVKQRRLVRWSLASHARYPNETNLDIHYSLPEDGIWNNWLQSRDDPGKDILVQPKASEQGRESLPPSGPRKLVDNTPASLDTYESILTTPKPPQLPSSTIHPALCSSLLYKLRWANIGWYYHWGTKQYDFTKGKGTIDEELREVCKSAVTSINWDQVFEGSADQWGDAGPEWKTWDKAYEPDAGIVNFYQTKDTLMAHVDRSEVCATSPLVSISLGNAAVFLIGGLTRDSEPVPIILRSGDVVIMSGPACRRAYHGVPRILDGTLPPHLEVDSMAEDERSEWEPYENYMRTTRINVNVRQVFPKGFDPGFVYVSTA
ncbi:hypothetical protein BDQ12DRAFT_623854 [Crucibulum laeve]|uniref:Fe2OG dioxygenase domain-containing protein n=1 Tax=Crucibulum laeve TaxID=68775 RepID=A0A5C3MFJ5_9AGAR|nr:hypothetical protein BDQ12DRAFT_623854 [Crucibulum laeve]